jgi:2-keto-4-pentenoate hydratase/2-oxohepta-3-ene-1,7-dioic acid hydratase in catechol pathway
VALSEAKLLPPVEPSKIVCVGRNYRDHAAELGNEVPAEPLLFFKPPSSLLAPGAAIQRPPQASRVDYEGELAIVIGRQARALNADVDLRPYIRGYTIVNDVTARDLQKRDGQWTRAKCFDTFCPCGPFVSGEINPALGVFVETKLNGERKQYGFTRDFIFSVPRLLVYITAAMTRRPPPHRYTRGCRPHVGRRHSRGRDRRPGRAAQYSGVLKLPSPADSSPSARK